MDARRFFILETLLVNGDSTEREIMSRLWSLDAANRDERKEPWAWYYNTTKFFSLMETSGLIEISNHESADGRKMWTITENGGRAFIDEIQKATIFADSLFSKRKSKIVALVSKAS